MKVLFGSVELAGTGRVQTRGLTVNGVPQEVQESAPIGDEELNQFDRGNGSTQIAFTVTRTFATLSQCETWMQDHVGELRGIRSLRTETELGVRYYRKAAVRLAAMIQVGVSVDVSYTIKGGIARSEP